MRLFIAIDIPRDLRLATAGRVEEQRRRQPPARWVRSENLHLTLLFLGETDEGLLPALHRGLSEVCGGFSPLRLRLSGSGWFPPRRAARVLWIGFEPCEPLLAVQAAVAGRASEIAGMEPEGRPFHPHLTLARCKRPWPRPAAESWADLIPSPFGEEFVADQVVLYRSVLGPGGASYEVEGHYPLGKSG